MGTTNQAELAKLLIFSHLITLYTIPNQYLYIEMNAAPVGLRLIFFRAVDLFLCRKSIILHEQNFIYFQFYIRMLNFRLLCSIIKKVPQGSRTP